MSRCDMCLLSHLLLTPPMKVELTVCSETSAYKIQMSGDRPNKEYNRLKCVRVKVIERLLPSVELW